MRRDLVTFDRIIYKWRTVCCFIGTAKETRSHSLRAKCW